MWERRGPPRLTTPTKPTSQGHGRSFERQPLSDETSETPANPMRQNAELILALAGFKCVLNIIKYKDLCRPLGFLELDF